MESKLKGVILAAGVGSRFNSSKSIPSLKPLALLEGKPLLIRSIQSLEKAGCRQIIIVLGWEAEKIQKEILNRYDGPSELQFVNNKRYDLQNGVSALAARSYIEGNFILIMADHLFDDKIMHLVSLHHPPTDGAILCVDYKLETIFDMDDATKVLEEYGYIKDIGKHISKFNCIDTGAFICTEGLLDAIYDIYTKKGDASLSDGIQILAHNGLIKALDIKDAFWQDVDTYKMLSNAKKLLKTHKKKNANGNLS